MKNIIIIIAAALLILTACNNDKNQSESNEMHSQEMHNEADGHSHNEQNSNEHSADGKMEDDITTQKNKSTAEIIDAYLQIKNALFSDNQDEAVEGGKALLTAFANFNMSKLSAEQHKEYMEIFENAKEQAEHIVKNPIDHQREHFVVLSSDISDLITLLGTDKTLYQDFCPMTNEGEGAIWISETKEIKNPFFGSQMPKCGNIQKVIN